MTKVLNIFFHYTSRFHELTAIFFQEAVRDRDAHRQTDRCKHTEIRFSLLTAMMSNKLLGLRLGYC